MRNSRLIQLLEALNKKEIRELRKVVQSPFFNQRADVIKLYEYLTDCLFVYKIRPEKTQIFKHVYPNKTYDDHRVRVIMSLLYKCIEHFLAQQAFFEEEINAKLKLAKVYRQRQLPNHFQRTIKAARQLQEQQPLRNADYYNDFFQLQMEQYHFSSESQRIGEHNLQEISNNMDIAFLTLKLRQTCFSISHQTVYKKEYHYGLLPEIIQYIEEQNLLTIPAIAIYYYCYHALTQPEQDHYYEQLKIVFFRHSQAFPSAEIRDLFLLAINYFIKRINAGMKRFEQEMLEWYQEGLQQGYLMVNGVLSRFTYRNVVTIGLITQHYDWIEHFIHSYGDQLEKQHRESTYSFNLARLEYARHNYDRALQLLQKSEYKDLLLNLSAKTIALKIYFELQEFDLLESHLSAMKNFIRRKKVMGYHQENYLSLLHFTRKLLELPPYDKHSRAQLRLEIEATKVVAEKVWLLEMIK